MYEIIVLGATFVAAGIANKFKKDCLVIEGRGDAGYEFFGNKFISAEEFSVYPYLKECDAVFCAEIYSVEKCDEGFICETHGVDGFVSYKAKRVVDTRAFAKISAKKTYDMLIESSEVPCFLNADCKKARGQNRFVVELAVPLFCDFADARLLALELVKSFSDTTRLILLADEFSYHIKADYEKHKNGILYLPSCSFENPKFAFSAGEAVEK